MTMELGKMEKVYFFDQEERNYWKRYIVLGSGLTTFRARYLWYLFLNMIRLMHHTLKNVPRVFSFEKNNYTKRPFILDRFQHYTDKWWYHAMNILLQWTSCSRHCISKNRDRFQAPSDTVVSFLVKDTVVSVFQRINLQWMKNRYFKELKHKRKFDQIVSTRKWFHSGWKWVFQFLTSPTEGVPLWQMRSDFTVDESDFTVYVRRPEWWEVRQSESGPWCGGAAE